MARSLASPLLLLLGCCSVVVLGAASAFRDIDNSQGYLTGSIPWKSLADVRDPGFKSDGRPYMYLVSREGCPACKALKTSVNEGGEHTETLKDLADDFIMVAVSEEEAKQKDNTDFFLDSYVPRVLFADANNKKIAKKVDNRDTNPPQDSGNKFPYFYPDAESLVTGMSGATTYFQDAKVKAKRKVEKQKLKEEEKKNPGAAKKKKAEAAAAAAKAKKGAGGSIEDMVAGMMKQKGMDGISHTSKPEL